LREAEEVPDHLLAHLSPLGWEHVNMTGDYIWSPADQTTVNADGYRPLRTALEARNNYNHYNHPVWSPNRWIARLAAPNSLPFAFIEAHSAVFLSRIDPVRRSR
jgi:hypothetical protein